MLSSVPFKGLLKAWLGERRCRRIAYASWLSSARGPQSGRPFVPNLGSRCLLSAYHALGGEFGFTRCLQVLPSPVAKVHAIRSHARRYGTRFFVETGTYLGDTTAAVMDLFERCWTVEYSPRLYENARRRFHGSNVECVQGDSGQLLPAIVANLPGPTLFWLDAHASGGITADAGYDPILSELNAIFPATSDIVLIDDACGQDVDAFRHLAGPDYDCILKNNILRLTPRSDGS